VAVWSCAVENLVTAPAYLALYRDANVLITGHTGFKGAWLSLWLKNLGANVTGFALPPEDIKRDLYAVANVEDEINSVYGDLRDLTAVSTVIKDIRPDIIFHLGAQSLVRRSYAEPVSTYATNVMGAVNLLEAARHCRETKAIVIVTSDKCYQNRELGNDFVEDDPMGGLDPYSSSKGCAELVTNAYRHSFFQGPNAALVGSARAGNVIGGGDWCEDRLIPDIVRSVEQDKAVIIRNPNSVRPWQHVLEPLRGYLMLGAQLTGGNDTFAEGWNFGPKPDAAIAVQKIAQRFVEIWGQGSVKSQPDLSNLHEAHLLTLDIGKSQSKLGFSPVLDIEETLKLTADWYRKFLENPENAQTLCLDQLLDYTRRLP